MLSYVLGHEEVYH